jgi:hypothetical protein
LEGDGVTANVQYISSDRVGFYGPLSALQARQVAADPTVKHFQTSEPATEQTWRTIDAEVCARRSDITIRVYGHYGTACDLSLVRWLSNVRRFEVDAHNVQRLDELEQLGRLEHLGLAVFEASDLSILSRVSDTLVSLEIGATRSKKPDMAPLARFRDLRTLYVEGQSKNIEVIAELTKLEDLTLRSVTTPDLRYVQPLTELRSLDIKLGGIRSLDGATGKPSIKYLELWQIRSFDDGIEGLSDFPGLQHLFLQSLRLVTRFPDMSRSERLRRIDLMNVKGLRDFTTIERLKGLEEFSLVEGHGQQPEDLIPVLRNANLRRARAGFGSKRRNDRFLELLSAYGKRHWTEHDAFVFT